MAVEIDVAEENLEGKEGCTPRHALTVELLVRSPLNQKKAGPYTAGTATKTTGDSNPR